MPVLPGFFAAHPEIQLDILVDDNLIDIVAERLDAGVRFGDIIDKDMIAVRLGPDVKMCVVGTPAYFAAHPAPRTPRDLANHQCINYRHVKTGGLYAWDFDEKGRALQVRVSGPLTVNNSDVILEAVLAGQGLAMFTRIRSQPISRPVALSGPWRSGARHSRATTSITRVAGRRRPPWQR